VLSTLRRSPAQLVTRARTTARAETKAGRYSTKISTYSKPVLAPAPTSAISEMQTRSRPVLDGHRAIGAVLMEVLA
jgi:hypothetical protein